MGITYLIKIFFVLFIPFLFEMKLFSLLAGTALANKGDDRVFANSIHFIQGSMSSWREVSGENQLKVIQRGTDDFFDTFFVGDDKKTVRVRDNLKKLLADTKNKMDSARARCSPWNVDRKRRSTEVSERWTMPDDVQTAWHQLFVLYARYVREETYPKCPKKALRFYKRLDRLRLYTGFHFCDLVNDENAVMCDTPLRFNANGVPFPHPRKNPKIEHHYGALKETSLSDFACEAPKWGREYADLSCPFGGTINIRRAEYGRNEPNRCSGDWDLTQDNNRNWQLCSNYVDVKAYAVQQCQGKSECRIEAKNSIGGVIKERQDPCVGIPKYTQVVWTCGDYDEPANPYLGPNDKGFEVACENKNKQFGPSSAEMACEDGEEISVDVAQYGRWDGATCPPKSFMGIYTGKCADSKDVLADAKAKCDGKQTCSYSASNAVAGDPCNGVYKYTRAKYSCKKSYY